MPQTKDKPKRKASDLAIPKKGDDAVERKRVLNVLAQWRYRQRRRVHVKKLEAQQESGSPPAVGQEHSTVPSAIAEKGSSQAFDTAAAGGLQIDTSEAQQPDFETGLMAFDDRFAVFDPNFVTFPTDLQASWDGSARLPSLPNSPLSPSNEEFMSLTSFSSPGSSETSIYSFPDEAHLPVVELNLLRGAMAIATRLNIGQIIWSLDSTSPFTDPSMALANFNHLPRNLRPTRTQLSQPHHPVLDLLPWPTVRDKLIIVFSQPADIRPQTAASPTALVELVYDIEDSAEGVRIWGEDPYSDQSWEVGEKLFKNWWWALDRAVVRRSNEMRRSRGARLLGEGSILGELI